MISRFRSTGGEFRDAKTSYKELCARPSDITRVQMQHRCDLRLSHSPCLLPSGSTWSFSFTRWCAPAGSRCHNQICFAMPAHVSPIIANSQTCVVATSHLTSASRPLLQDFTFVCPTEITAFSDRHGDFKDLSCEVRRAPPHSRTMYGFLNTSHARHAQILAPKLLGSEQASIVCRSWVYRWTRSSPTWRGSRQVRRDATHGQHLSHKRVQHLVQ